MKKSGVFRYVIGKLAGFVLTLFIVSLLIFFLERLSNVDPIAVILGGKRASEETIAILRDKFGLDLPIWQQYFNWIAGMLRGDFGTDFNYQQPVWSLILPRLGVTLPLILMSSILTIAISVPIGVFCAVKQGSALDTGLSAFCLAAVSCPGFFVSMMAIAIVSKTMPSVRFTGSFSGFSGMMERLLLPAICMALGMIALGARVIRSKMITELDSDYILFARAGGISERKVVFSKALRSCVIPYASVMSIQIGSMLVGAVTIEEVFSLQGVGSLLISSIQGSNYPVTQAITMITVFFFLLLTTAVDIIIAIVDPRVRKGEASYE